MIMPNFLVKGFNERDGHYITFFGNFEETAREIKMLDEWGYTVDVFKLTAPLTREAVELFRSYAE